MNSGGPLSGLIEPVPGGLGAYRPQLRYVLLDQGRSLMIRRILLCYATSPSPCFN